jgi:hypothetical protein
MRSFLLVCLFVVAGCGVLPIGSKSARCDLRPKRDQCTDIRNFVGPSLVTFQGVCETLKSAAGGATYTENATCDSGSSLGGCQGTSAEGSKQTNWYYQGSSYPDAAAAMSQCDSGQTWVGPQQ